MAMRLISLQIHWSRNVEIETIQVEILHFRLSGLVHLSHLTLCLLDHVIFDQHWQWTLPDTPASLEHMETSVGAVSQTVMLCAVVQSPAGLLLLLPACYTPWCCH